MYIIPIIITILLLVIWFLIGELGFFIWQVKIFDTYNPKPGAEYVELKTTTLACRNRFRLTGLVGLIYALNYSANKE